MFNCIGTVNKDKEGLVVITLSGDQRSGVAEFLIHEGIGKRENIKIHGAWFYKLYYIILFNWF